jgi:uncharacterized protein
MNRSRPQLFGMLAGLFLAAGLVLSAMLGTTAWVKIKNSQFISVKGSARKNIRSDFAIWTANFSVQAPTLLEAQRQLRDDRDKVEVFLNDAGMTNHFFKSIAILEQKATFENEITNKDYGDGWKIVSSQEKTVGYKLSESVEVHSDDVDHVARLDSDSTTLVEQGVLLTTDAPKFIYTQAAEAKIEMLAEATKDARTRAEQIAGQGYRQLAGLHDADMGVFQIAPLRSSDTSGEGVNDTSSLDKTITAVVTATFLLK